jgi:hypothetical protein
MKQAREKLIRKMRKAKYQKTNDLKTIRKIQELYTKNLNAYRPQIRDPQIKQVIKNSYKIADLFKKIEVDGDDFASSWVKEQTEMLENKFYKSSYRDFGVEYEAVQVAIHSELRAIGNFHECLDHKINLHYCSKCKEKFGVGEDGDE